MLSQARDLPNVCLERFLSSPALGFNRIYWQGFAEKYQVAESAGLVSACWILIVARTLGIFFYRLIYKYAVIWSEGLDQGSRHRPAPSSPLRCNSGLLCWARLQLRCLQTPFKPLLQGRRYLHFCLITPAPISRQFRLGSGENCIVRTALLVCIGVTKTPRSLGCAL